MNYIVYRENNSTGALELAGALAGVRYQKPKTIGNLLDKPDRRLVYWGSYTATNVAKERTLNGVPVGNKITDAAKLTAAGVPTIIFSTTVPAVVPVIKPDFIETHQQLATMTEDLLEVLPDTVSIQLPTSVFLAGLTDMKQLIEKYLTLAAAPTVPAFEWLPRLKNHVGGADLIAPPASPDYWVKRESIVKEFRVHSFLSKSIRAGMKVVRDNFTQDQNEGEYYGPYDESTDGPLVAHPWVRSFDSGWRISYDGETVKQKHRDIAHAAVKALGLDFGAVDIAERPDGSLFVLEVNRAPGIEAGTIEAYVRAIRRWAGEEVA